MSTIMDDFLIRALLAGCAVALVAGPLGAFVVWRRMAYFGATLSHASLLGIALGLLLGIKPTLGVLAVCIVVALLMGLRHRSIKTEMLSEDTMLGILAHGTLALGLVAVAFLGDVRFDLNAYLFGDILAVTTGDLYGLYLGGVVVATILAFIWRPLLSATVDEELAIVEGIPVHIHRLVYMLVLAGVVALAMKVVGILLVTSLLIIPAAAARQLSTTPEQMGALAALCGCLSIAGGLWGSATYDTPSGPSIVVASLVLFVASRLFRRSV
ncbi:MAG: metal ABC transporter permease [Rhodospirillaceae bacterium]|nr:metal ABC transporter permease [Rhodospirillaceae bacterium]MBL6930583.1 metal ABC transporter permease [Rhodospirillales bacterium]MBL6942292.1 metal ABC transporter permease [Rhodospirillales bacterium]